MWHFGNENIYVVDIRLSNENWPIDHLENTTCVVSYGNAHV